MPPRYQELEAKLAQGLRYDWLLVESPVFFFKAAEKMLEVL